MNHPFENGTGACMYCGTETQVGEFIVSSQFTRDTLEGCGWACFECEEDVHGGHGEEWTIEERADADRMWASVGKQVIA